MRTELPRDLYLCRVMQEFFFTVLAIWVVWKLFSAFSSDNSRPRTTNNFHTENHYHSTRQEGEITIKNAGKSNAKKQGDDGEYVEYEEIKD